MYRRSPFERLKAFDFHAKSADEVKESSPFGAVVSFFAYLLLGYLLISELGEYWTPTKTMSLAVNQNRDEKMRINFRIIFIDLPCESIEVDVSDRMGDDTVAVGPQHISKTPWQGNFMDAKSSATKNLGWFTRGKQAFESQLWGNMMKNKLSRKIGLKGMGRGTGKERDADCLPCGEAAQLFPSRCCPSCQELKKAYTAANIPLERAAVTEQCSNGNDACLVSGNLPVNKVQGNFHVAVGASHVQSGQGHHHHWAENERKLGFNTSHYISHLSFGAEFPGMENPLDSFEFIETGVGQQQYFIQVVPTLYERTNGKLIETNQYSATYQHRKIVIEGDHPALPGVFFRYDISPLIIHMKESSTKNLGQFVARSFAVVGGVWAVVGIIYGIVKGVWDKIKKMAS